jgi:predicted RNA binding protein YcfA (HicA-like mRNA interferase family)
MPRLTAAQIVRVLLRRGFAKTRQSGSHAIYQNEAGMRATVPAHSGKVLHPKVLKSIMRDADLSTSDLMNA